jgi:hypothetical protein
MGVAADEYPRKQMRHRLMKENELVLLEVKWKTKLAQGQSDWKKNK